MSEATDICTPASSLPSSCSCSGRSTKPRTCRYFLPLMLSRERHRSVSPAGKLLNGEATPGEGSIAASKGFEICAVGVPGKDSSARKVTPKNQYTTFSLLIPTARDVPSNLHPSFPISSPPLHSSLQPVRPRPTDPTAPLRTSPFSPGVLSGSTARAGEGTVGRMLLRVKDNGE